MIDIVIPYVQGPDKGFELRYALRSIAMYFNFPYRIWLIGDKPDWCIRVQHLSVVKPLQKPYRSFSDTTNKLKTALEQSEIHNDFIYMYDDTYITKPLNHLPINWALTNMTNIPTSQWFTNSKADNIGLS